MYRKHSGGMAASWRPNERLAFVFGHHEPFHDDWEALLRKKTFGQ
ncbi:hypothetical protein [Salicibibacter cibi]|nr:hypothetical protein [Salicibibacter cibi]